MVLLIFLLISSFYILYLHFHDFFYLVKTEEPVLEYHTFVAQKDQSFGVQKASIMRNVLKGFLLRRPAFRMSKDTYTGFRDYLSSLQVSFSLKGYCLEKQQISDEYIIIEFRNRFAFFLFSNKVIFDYLLKVIVNCVIFFYYHILVLTFYLMSQIVALFYLKHLSCERKNREKNTIFQEYFDLWFPAEGNSVTWPYTDIGYFLFKLLEGYQFRKAVRTFRPSHMSCEFGIHDGVISSVHLKGIDFIDYGCEVIKHVFPFEQKRYKNFRNCKIENNTFKDDYFSSIFLIHIVDHIPELRQAFKQLNRITKPGGTIFLSGLTDDFSGYYLEKVCAQGEVYNNDSLEWYEQLCSETGFQIIYQAYMHSGLSSIIWKMIYPLIVRFYIVEPLSNCYTRFKLYRKLYRFLAHQTCSKLFLIDEAIVQRTGKGLNFFAVAAKKDNSQAESVTFRNSEIAESKSTMLENPSKPKIIYFRWPLDNYPEYGKGLFNRIFIKGLSEFFELIVISNDCDYGVICEKYQPDITLFESGNNGLGSPLRITNTSAFPEIAKLGFVRPDPFCASRTTFLSDMDRWGVETFFTYVTATGEYTPEIADQVFYWPFFVDTELFRDYGERKIIPVIFFGNTDLLQYEWRKRTKEIITKYYATLFGPHELGTDPKFKPRVIHGEQYARMINAAYFAPTCGCMAKLLVMKHLEIPACRTCLVTEKTPAVEAFGFADMENCVFADETDVVDKLDYLFANKDILTQITNNGYQLVRMRHTVKQRNQILQWFQLYTTLKPGQRIVQTGLFDDLRIVDASSGIKNRHIMSGGLDRILLRQGDLELWTGRYGEAEALYRKCLDYVDYMPEPKLRLTMCNLYKGDATAALQWLREPIKWTLDHGGLEPDPIEWAYFLIVLLCQGNSEKAVKYAYRFQSLRHAELDRARWAVFVVASRWQKAKRIIMDMRGEPRYRKSVHQLPELSFNDGIENICMMLHACKQHRSTEILQNFIHPNPQDLEDAVHACSEETADNGDDFVATISAEQGSLDLGSDEQPSLTTVGQSDEDVVSTEETQGKTTTSKIS